jgi:hypothetical protein
VHPLLKMKLDRAASPLQSKGLAVALKFGEIGGFDIRNNVNSPTELSNHNFSWAVDLDAELNPNIKRTNLPLAVIAGLTGLDLYGPVSQALCTPHPSRMQVRRWSTRSPRWQTSRLRPVPRSRARLSHSPSPPPGSHRQHCDAGCRC